MTLMSLWFSFHFHNLISNSAGCGKNGVKTLSNFQFSTTTTTTMTTTTTTILVNEKYSKMSTH